MITIKDVSKLNPAVISMTYSAWHIQSVIEDLILCVQEADKPYSLGFANGLAAAIAVCDDYGTREAQIISKTLGDMMPNVELSGN